MFTNTKRIFFVNGNNSPVSAATVEELRIVLTNIFIALTEVPLFVVLDFITAAISALTSLALEYLPLTLLKFMRNVRVSNEYFTPTMYSTA